MEFSVYRFGDFCKMFAGGDAPKDYMLSRTKEKCYPVYSNGIENEGLYGYCDYYTMPGNTLTISARGTVGVVFYRSESFLPIVRLIALVVDEKIADTRYIYYLLKCGRIDGYGTSQQQITIPYLKKKRIQIITSLDKQKKIASILSVYDNLIEVNNKRIKVLEQMAESLYKEWFVRFRFPGHETAEFEHGIPKGWFAKTHKRPKNWHYGSLSELGMFVRGKNITSDEMIEGTIPVVSAGIEPSGFHNESNVQGKSITVSASGANAGYLKYNLDDIWAADCSYLCDNEAFWFIYNALKYLQPVISNLQCGAAQPHVYPKHINKLCIIIPERRFIEEYCRIVSPFYEEIGKLKKANDSLVKQRDYLLPRLMSGKLEVI